MLMPKKPSETAKQRFVVLDIENWPDGSVLSISTMWRNASGEIEYIRYDGWSAWWKWYVLQAENYKDFRQIFAHNGGSWDWCSLMAWLLTHGHAKHDGISVVCPNSKIIVARIMCVSPTGGKPFQVTLADSYEILHSSLDDLGRKFIGRGKVDLQGKLPHEIYLEDRQKFAEYERADCEILLLVLEKALRIIRDRIAKIDKLSNTIGGLALKIFRTIGMDNVPYIMSPWKSDLKALLREGLSGGRVELFATARDKVQSGVNVYDVNSMYPSVMMETKVPTTGRAGLVSENHEIKPEEVGIYYVYWNQKNRKIPAILCENNMGSYEGETAAFSPELHAFRKYDPGGTLHIKRGYVFIDTSALFSEYVRKLYALRIEDRTGPVGMLCKSILVSLWGKFSQKPEQETVIAAPTIADLFARIRGGETVRPINTHAARIQNRFAENRTEFNDPGDIIPVFTVTGETHCEHEHVGIAGIIASAARVRLYDGLLQAGRGLLYCDTDSVHVRGKLSDSMLHDTDLGRWKTVYADADAAYCGRKLYSVKWDGGEKVIAKGITVGGRHGAKVSHDDLCNAVTMGVSISADFGGVATAKEVFQGRAPCVFVPRDKKIRKETVALRN